MHVATDIDKVPTRALGCSIDPMSVLLVIQVSSIFFRRPDMPASPVSVPSNVFICSALPVQAILIVLFGTCTTMAPSANPLRPSVNGTDPGLDMVIGYYPMFQDVHVMIFIGFGA
jgi:hypothetical protein